MAAMEDTVNWLKNGSIAEKAIFAGALLVLVALVGFTAIELLG